MRSPRGNVAAMMVGLLLSSACGDPADFRPAKGVKDLPATKTAYRVQQADPTCNSIGFVKRASSIDDIAETVANNGGTHYRVLNDESSTTLETEGVATKNFGVVHSRSTSRLEKHHLFTAEAYRCD